MLQITYKILDENYEEFKRGFLKDNPVPIGVDMQPKLTEGEWIKQWGRKQFLRAYKSGRQRILEEELTTEENIIT